MEAQIPHSHAGSSSSPQPTTDPGRIVVPSSRPTLPASLNGRSGAPAEQATLAGRLSDETPDVMVLHTQEAYRMFVGRSADPAEHAPAITGGRRFAAVLRSLWQLSANDNPYADWILVQVYQILVEIRGRMSKAIELREAEFDRLRRRGLSLSVVHSASPLCVALGFRSPYGYATAEAIVEFDYHVRMVKTLVMKDRMSDDDGRAAIREIGRALRALFLLPIRWERVLFREEMLALSRRDYLPGADLQAKHRVRAATAVFGEVPRRVFTGEEAPRHSQRRHGYTQAELRLLAQVPLNFDDLPPNEPRGLV